jgi:hypothetical protein
MKSLAEDDRGTTTFMAECFWPGVSVQSLADAAERLREASQRSGGGADSSRLLGSILVPTDEIALLLVAATSLAAATDLATRAAIPCERIVEIRLGSFLLDESRHPDRTSKELR